MGRDNPFENAARGRDASGINEDELTPLELRVTKENEHEILLECIDFVCLRCVRPDAWEGGEEACEGCYVRKTADDWANRTGGE